MEATKSTAWTWQFPVCPQWIPKSPETRSIQMKKIIEEVKEAADEQAYITPFDPYTYIAEVMDVIHACETALREFPAEVLDSVKRDVVSKNYERGYYGGV